ncbi:MAG: translation initiation factor IF-2 [Niameybacter sp.]
MSKVRVYEIAKQLNKSTKEILDQLKQYGFDVHSHMSSLLENEVNLIMEYYKQETKDKEVDVNKVIKLPTPTLSKLETAKKVETIQENMPTSPSKQQTTPQTNKTYSRPDLTHQVKSTKGKNKKKNKNKKVEKAGNMGQQKFDNENTKNVNDEIKVIEIPASISIRDFAEKLDMPAIEIIKHLMKKGTMATINQEIDFEMAAQVAEEFDIIVEQEEEKDLLEEIFKEVEDREEELESRSPVVVVMGHVDHGKTSLLDAIRSTHVTTVTLNGKKITFLDTPGHEAFTAMRMRGAQVTDIAILVVAADDGVMPQTIEAINHARAAGIEIIVAVNKMDKPGANPDRVKQELADQGLLVEDWGGETICVPVSALKGEGLENLLEMVLLVAEMNNYKANPNCKARGTIIEAQLDKGRGPVATVLVQRGMLKVGDPIVAGTAYGRIRAMVDDKGRQVKKAGPSTPVEILGLSEVPIAGDMFYVANSDKQARQAADKVKAQGRLQILGQSQQKVSLDDLYNQIQEGQMKELNIIVKADVQGSVEAVKQSLERLSNEDVRIRIIHGAVGAITESDLMLASASGAIIIGFNVRPDTATKAIADREEIDIRLYRVIYNAIEDIKAAMKGMLDPEFVEKVTGHIEIRQTFKVSGVGTVAGGYVLDGKVARHSGIRIVRDSIVVYEGKLASLKRFKDDVKEVNTNYECGLMFERFNDIKEGDIAEAFIMEEIPR